MTPKSMKAVVIRVISSTMFASEVAVAESAAWAAGATIPTAMARAIAVSRVLKRAGALNSASK